MGKQEAPFHVLEQFLPEGTFRKVAPFFRDYNIHLSISHDRVTILGDYRSPTREYPAHRISINGSLNPYSFLITLLHELAHMLAYIKFRRSIQPHGTEWREIFAELLGKYMGRGIFPDNVEEALINYQGKITASTCSDPDLYRALKKHDRRKKHMRLVEEIPLNEHFETHDGRVFQKIEKLRTRFRCQEVGTGYVYLFPAVAEVKLIG
jgi:SprT protein